MKKRTKRKKPAKRRRKPRSGKQKKKDTAKLKKLAVWVLAALAVLCIGALVWFRGSEVRKLHNATVVQLEGEGIALLTGAEAKEKNKVVLLFFILSEEDGFSRLEQLAIVDVGHWVLEIPIDAFLSDGEEGYIEVGKLYAAGERVVEDYSGVTYLIERFEVLAGVKIDGYIAVSDRAGDTPQGISSPVTFAESLSLSQFWLYPKKTELLVGSICSNTDLDLILRFAEQLRAEDISYETLSLAKAEAVLFQGRPISVFEKGHFDEVFGQFPVATPLLLEQARIEVYNGTNISGMAGRYSRFFRNSGLDVVRVEDSPEYADKTVVYLAGKADYTNTVDVLIHDMGTEVEVTTGRPSFVTTGDIIIVLGYDLATW